MRLHWHGTGGLKSERNPGAEVTVVGKSGAGQMASKTGREGYADFWLPREADYAIEAALGLDRHEAVHAIGSVVAAQLYAVLQHRAFDSVEYEARLDALTADSWRLSADET
jgi:hypothetical protein